MTCLANDIGYESVYSHQINVKGEPRDLLLALSGSGNSKNIMNAIEAANKVGMKSVAILAFGGGKCRKQPNLLFLKQEICKLRKITS